MHRDFKCPGFKSTHCTAFLLKLLLYFHPFTLRYSNIATGNPLHKWRFSSLNKSQETHGTFSSHDSCILRATVSIESLWAGDSHENQGTELCTKICKCFSALDMLVTREVWGIITTKDGDMIGIYTGYNDDNSTKWDIMIIIPAGTYDGYNGIS